MKQFKENANRIEIINEIISTWQQIELALTPIIGRRGVNALYKRTLLLTSQTYPWLTDTTTDQNFNLAVLKSTLAQQNSSTLTAASSALLKTFYELLTVLVGASLTERLLLSIATISFSNAFPRDTSL